MASLAEKLRAELGEEQPTPRKATPRNGNSNGVKSPLFTLANNVDTVALLDRLGIAHEETNRGEMATCPGCGEDGALVCKDGGLKCMHDRCKPFGVPSKDGFRTNVDLVMHVRQLDKVAAAMWVCEQFGIEVPKLAAADDYVHTDADAPDAPPEEPKASASSSSAPLSPAQIIGQWQDEGPLVRIPTGIDALDRVCRGGLPIPWRVVIVGAPSAGKTALEMVIADRIARAAAGSGAYVGILGVDEEPEDLTVRLAQIAGFSVADVERRDPEVIREMTEALEGLPIRLYDATYTIESAAADLAGWCKADGKRGVLFIDSLQAVRSIAGDDAKGPREEVKANVRAMREVSARFRLLVIATSEANRASYRSDAAASETNDLAAGSESSAIEYAAKTQLMLRTPKDHPDVVHVRVAKNRRAQRGEFWLRMDFENHSLSECPDPSDSPETAAERQEQSRASNRAAVLRDAEELARILVHHPEGLGEMDLRAELRESGHRWGIERLNAARLLLQKGHKGVRLGRDGKRGPWVLHPENEVSDE